MPMCVCVNRYVRVCACGVPVLHVCVCVCVGKWQFKVSEGQAAPDTASSRQDDRVSFRGFFLLKKKRSKTLADFPSGPTTNAKREGTSVWDPIDIHRSSEPVKSLSPSPVVLATPAWLEKRPVGETGQKQDREACPSMWPKLKFSNG